MDALLGNSLLGEVTALAAFGQKGECDCREDAEECRDIIPAQPITKVHDSEASEDRQSQNLLHDFELEDAELGTTPAIRGDHQDVLKKGYPPAHQDDLPERGVFVTEMAVPGHGHENI